MEKNRKFRKLGQQIEEICKSMGIMKRDIADRMGFSHSYLSQMIARGGTSEQIEALAKAVGVEASYFDRWHVLTMLDRIEGGDEFAQVCAFAFIDGFSLPPRKRKEFLEKLVA
jgi:transcriptional regulator with XRE-family HTH domain